MEYNHVQWGKSWLLAAAVFLGVLVPLLFFDDGTGTAASVAIALFTTVLLGVVVYSSRLEVTIEDGKVSAAFGFGWPKKVIDLAQVAVIRQVRNKWWYGFGSRKVPKGWMYNVWGLDAVELDLSDGKVFRIGTDDPETLFAVLSLHQ